MSHPSKIPDESRKGAGNTKGFRFSGEETSPVFGDDRHAGIDTSYLEVSPSELIDVAKHIWREKDTHQDVIKRAYQIICEAHLTSGNIRRWNEKVRRHGIPEPIFNLVEQSEKNTDGHPLRQPLLAAFMKSLGMGSDPSNASKRFNEWIKESERLRDYSATIPWNPNDPGFDGVLNERLRKNGWVQWFYDGGSGFLVTPPRTSPAKPLGRKYSDGEHVTTPYWDTTDVWWPVPDKETIEQRKSEYLNAGRDAFRSSYQACGALVKFSKWLELEGKMKKVPMQKKQPRNATGALVSPKDKGAGRSAKGQYGGTRKKSGNS